MSLSSEIKRRIKGLGFLFLESVSPVLDRSAAFDATGVNKVLVIGAGGIGDLIRVLPAIESLHKNFPAASVTLLASPSSAGILPLFPARGIIDEVVSYEPRERHRRFGDKVRLIRSLRKKGFDLSYAPSRGEGMREEMVMHYLIGAPRRLGFSRGRTGFLNTCTVEFSDTRPILMQNLEILKAAGLEVTSGDVHLEVPAESLASVDRFLEPQGIGRDTPFIAVHPGAAWNASLRCWPAERYIGLIRAVRGEFGKKIVVIGSEDETATGEAICRGVRDASVLNAVGKTDILQMAGIISRSSLFIGNDSGPLHLAQAFGVPSVAIFGLTSPDQVLWRRDACISIRPPRTDTLYLHQYDYAFDGAHAKAIERVTVEEVLAGVRRAVRGML